MRIKYVFIIMIAFACVRDKEEVVKEYHSNNIVSLTGTKLNDLKVGTWTKFDSLGKKITELEYDSAGFLVKRSIYTNGFLFAEEEMNGDDIKHGLSTFYFGDGSIESTNYFINNQQLGEQKFFFEDGSISSEYVETDSGIINFKQYYLNGNLMVEANSLINGEVYVYDSLGKNMLDLLYKEGELADTLRKY